MEEIITTFHPRHFLQEFDPKNIYTRYCILCEKKVNFQPDIYYCRACDIHFHKECATTLMESDLTINHLETHEHTLTFIRTPNSFKCVACGKIYGYKMNMYVCLPCNFFIHKECIYLPKVIKITRHSHRLFHTFQLYDGNMNCQVCNEKIVCGYGGYHCIDKTCDYKLHSYCATNINVWDGKDVEIINHEDVPSSSLETDEKTIRHFSHDHDLVRLYINEEDEEDGRVCQACNLPIDFDSFLSCKECDFALHDTCASLPRKMENSVHRHPLILEVDMMNIKDGFFNCSICDRESCGFMYRCYLKECGFKLDAKCASFTEPFYHNFHQHPLTLYMQYNENIIKRNCSGCRLYAYFLLACNNYNCRNDFYLDFKCAFLPKLVKCKYDIHPVTFCTQSTWDSLYWRNLLRCDICEAGMDWKELLFYICYDCKTFLHVECLIGRYPYMKPGHTIKVNGIEIQTTSNRLSRPICSTCHGICKDKLVFICKRDGVCFCSMECIRSSTKATGNLTLTE